MKNLGLYVHIPFCASKCGYCDFYSLPDARELIPDYVKALRDNIEEASRFVQAWTVDTIYFGGGTPTFVGEKNLSALLKTLKKRFTLSSVAEITLEANPDSVDLRSLKKLRRAGFNRLSMGVQSASDEELGAIGRIHTFAQAKEAFAQARAAGFDNIGLDVIYGLPGQTGQSWENTLREIIALNPEHISSYGLKLEEGTPLYEAREILSFPDEEHQVAMYMQAVQILAQAGYEQYEISNFAKPSRRSRHNMKYWNLEPYMGFGAAAHSDFDGRRYSYVKDVRAYISGVGGGESIVDEMGEIPLTERADEYIMLRLRTGWGISTNEYMDLFRATSFDPIEKVLITYEKHGYAVNEGDVWRLTPKGYMVSNHIIADILSCSS